MMNAKKTVWLGFALLLLLNTMPENAWSISPIHNKLKIEFEPSNRFAIIEDHVSFNTSKDNCHSYSFYLHANLKINSQETLKGWQIETSKVRVDEQELIKIKFEKDPSLVCPESFSFVLKYSGVLFDSSGGADETKLSNGFFYSGASYFYPHIVDHEIRVTFEMEVSLPLLWHSVSQGKRSEQNLPGGRNVANWVSKHPSEEIYLIGNKFNVYEKKVNEFSLYAFLLTEDDELVDRYFRAAEGYIDFYAKLLAPYPYEKFALVENSQQTGYGMPSFTLMGSRIIRFPFILHSSYPHEILHNWLGNGVFPVLKEGNWSEGLTAYLSDHLLQELKGKGPQYRFNEIMKFSNYVNEKNDFPLSKFLYRENMSSQAIGYTKLLMVFHMLRAEIGDDFFLKGLSDFYKKYEYRYAGYEAMQNSFENVSGMELGWFFEQWIQRVAAPKIKLKQASFLAAKFGYDLIFQVEQSAPGFRIKLPIAIWVSGKEYPELQEVVLEKEDQEFRFNLPKEPVAIRLDPYNDVFRMPDSREAPPSLRHTYGVGKVTVFISKQELQNLSAEYKNLAQSIAKQKFIVEYDESGELPQGNLLFLGKSNSFKLIFENKLKEKHIELSADGVVIKENFYPWVNHSFVFTLYRPDGKTGTMTWVICNRKESITGLISKLPHYGKYGYLVFEGLSPANKEKGSWSSSSAGLQKVFKKNRQLLLPEQKPLISFSPMQK